MSGCAGKSCNTTGDARGCTAAFCYSGTRAPVYFHGVKDGKFSHAEFEAYWNGLTEGQRQSVGDKAYRERMTLVAVASQYGAVEPEPAAATEASG